VEEGLWKRVGGASQPVAALEHKLYQVLVFLLVPYDFKTT
jgi:hypothetical protein